MSVADLHDAATAPTGPSELQSFYVALREAFSGASDGLVGMLEERHQEHRALTRRIRELLQIAEDAEDAVFVALHQARGGVDEPLRGARLGRRAVEVLVRERGSDPIHYRDWFDLLAETDAVIAGKDQLATFLTAITRSPQVERVGGDRSGVYRLKGGAL